MSTIFRNSCFSTISFGLRFVSNAFLFIVIARFLGAEEFGRFALASSLAGIFLVIVDYGFNLYSVKEIAAAPSLAVELATDIISAKILLGVASTAVLLVVVRVMGYPAETAAIIYVLWVAYLFYSFGLFFNHIFRSFNLFEYEMYPTVLLNALQVVFVAVLLIMKCGTLAISAAFLGARVIYFLYSLFLLRKKIGKPGLRIDPGHSKALIVSTMPFGLHAIIGVLYFQLDTVLLSYFRTNAEIGYYQSAMRIVGASMIIYDVLASSFLPQISANIKKDFKAFTGDTVALNSFMILVGGVISMFLLVFADTVVRILYGTGYLEATLVLQLLSAVIFLRFLGGAYGIVMTVSEHQGFRAAGVAFSLVVNLLLNLVLIPRYGITGAASACIITHVFLNVLYIVFTYRIFKTCFFDRKIVPIIVCLIVASCAGHYLKPVSLIASALVFTALVGVSLSSSLFSVRKAIAK